MNYNGIELALLVKGRPVTEFPHRGQVFVEGRAGSEYEIEVRNTTSFRVEAVITVDGLSVTDGKPGSDQSSGYLIEPYGKISIPGWKVDGGTAAKFAFSGRKGGSYAAQMTGTARNDGVIGVLVYREERPRYVTPSHLAASPLSTGWHAGSGLRGLSTTGGVAGPLIGAHEDYYFAQSMAGNGSQVASLGHMPQNNTSYSTRRHSAATAASHTASRTKGITRGIVASSYNEPVEQSLGTSFGDATEFRTTTVEFQRGDLHATLVLYYDDSRGLKARGIVLERPSRQKLAHQPNPFPAMETGCQPPPGWEGRRRR